MKRFVIASGAAVTAFLTFLATVVFPALPGQAAASQLAPSIADENNNRSAFAGYFCGSASGNTLSNVMVRGYRPQNGGEGIDGINVSCGAVGVDYGDAPASYGSANHEITPATFLGVEVDAEAQQQPSALANGDNTAGGTAPNQSIDDEDGVGSFPPILGVTDTVKVDVTLTNRNPTLPATLVGWIDLNQNGTFGAAEGVSVLIPPSGPPPVSPPSSSTVTAKPASAWVSRSAPRRRSPGSRSSRHQQGQQGKAGMAGQGGWPRPGRAASRSLSTPV